MSIKRFCDICDKDIETDRFHYPVNFKINPKGLKEDQVRIYLHKGDSSVHPNGHYCKTCMLSVILKWVAGQQ